MISRIYSFFSPAKKDLIDSPGQTKEHKKEFQHILRQIYADNPGLKIIDLSLHEIGVDGTQELASALSNNNVVAMINLHWNNIGDIGAKILADILSRNNNIISLELSSNDISSTGAISLANALQTNQTLTEINLGGNYIGNIGAISLAKLLNINTSLERIDLSYNNLDDESAKALLYALQYNATVQCILLDGNNISLDLKNQIYNEVEINCNTYSKHDRTLFEQKVAKIKEYKKQLTSENKASPAKPIFHYRQTQGDIIKFQNIIKEINKEHKNTIIIKNHRIDHNDAKVVAHTVNNNNNISYLRLENTRIGDEGVKAIASALENNKAVKEICLRKNNICDNGAKAIANAIKNNETLAYIDLRINKIGDEGVKAIANALENNKVVKEICLRKNNICDNGAKAIANAIKNNETLAYINLGMNKIGDDGAIALLNAVKANTNITHLILDNNKINQRLQNDIKRALDINRKTNVQIVELRGNNLGDNDIKEMAYIWNVNFLANINLLRNNIGDEGTKFIASKLKNHKTVKEINLSYNKIGQAGAIEIASAIEKNTSLTAIDLEHNNIGSAGANYLLEALKSNITITSLHLGNNNISQNNLLNAIQKELDINKNKNSEEHKEKLDRIAKASKEQNSSALEHKEPVVPNNHDNNIKRDNHQEHKDVNITPASKADLERLSAQVNSNSQEIKNIKEQIGNISVKDLENFKANNNLSDYQQSIICNENFVEAINMVTGHMDSLKEIFQNHSALKLQQQQFNALMQDPDAKAYYQNIIAGLGAMYAAAQAVGSGYIDPDKQGGLGLIGKILGALSDSVPVLSSVGNFVGSFLEHIDKGMQKNKMSNITRLATTNQIMNEIASGVAIALIQKGRHKQQDAENDLNLIIKNILEEKILKDQPHPDQQLVVSELTSIFTEQSEDLRISSAIQILPGNVVANSAEIAASGNNHAVNIQQIMARISQLEQHNQDLEARAQRAENNLKALTKAVSPASKSVGDSGQMQEYLNQPRRDEDYTSLTKQFHDLRHKFTDYRTKAQETQAKLKEVEDYSRTNRDFIKQNQRGRTIVH